MPKSLRKEGKVDADIKEDTRRISEDREGIKVNYLNKTTVFFSVDECF